MTSNRRINNKCSKIVSWMNDTEGWITMFAEGQSLSNLGDNTKTCNICGIREDRKNILQGKKKFEAIVPEKLTNVVKDKLLHPYNGILFSNNKRNKLLMCGTTWMNLNRSYAEWKKPISKGYKPFDSIFMTICKRQKNRNKIDQRLPGIRKAENVNTTDSTRGCQGWGNCSVFWLLRWLQKPIYIKSHINVHPQNQF